MNYSRLAPLAVFLSFILVSGAVFAKADIVDLYAQAVITADIQELEKILAPNFWYIGANGHIMDKEHFIEDLKNKSLVVDRLSLRNQRDTKVGETRMVTANGVFYGKSDMPRPQGLMRYTMVIANNRGDEEVVLFQATPVISTSNCVDGNCAIK